MMSAVAPPNVLAPPARSPPTSVSYELDTWRGSGELTIRTSPIQETSSIWSSMYSTPANSSAGSPCRGTTTIDSTSRSRFDQLVR